MVDGGSAMDNQQRREQEWMMEAVESAEAGKGEIKDVITKEVKHEKAKKRNKAIVWGVGVGGAVAGVGAAAKIIRDNGWGEWLSEKRDAINKKISGIIPYSEKVVVMPKEANQELATNNERNDYSVGGLEGSLQIPGLDKAEHGNNITAIELAAKSGGPAWMLDTIWASGGKGLPEAWVPAVSEKAFGDIVKELNLDSASQGELRQIWGDYIRLSDQDKQNFDQNVLLNFLQAHGANTQVIEFYKYAMDLKAKDMPPDQWQDRVEPLKNWEPAATPQSSVHGGKAASWAHDGSVDLRIGLSGEVDKRGDFNQIAEMVFGDGVVGDGLGMIETAAGMNISGGAMPNMGLDITDILGSEKAFHGSFADTSLMITALLLIRIGPRLPGALIASLSEGIENVYYWFKLKQYERVKRSLMVLGEKVKNRFSGASRQ